MQDRGKRVLVLAEAALKHTLYPKFIEEVGVPVRWVDWSPEQGVAHNFRSAYKTFRSISADVIQFNISWRRGMWLVPVVARALAARRLIGTMRGMPDPHQDVPRRKHLGFIPGVRLWHLREFVAGWLWGRALDLTVSVNGLDFPHRLVRDYRYPPDRLRVVHNGMFFREQPLAQPDRLSLRRELGCLEEDFLVGYFGRLSDEKGVDLILSALAGLPARYRLVIAGDGPMEDELKRMATSLGLRGRVRFLGFLAKPDDTMAAADVIAVPSTWQEAGSRVIVEALNQGTPVIGSRTGGTPEMVADGVEGLIVAPGSVDDLARAIRTIGEDADLRSRMSAAARERMNRDFRMEIVFDRYAALYSELTATGS
jgi:glycosyltransferase involved in cell wall biosynthesis